VRVGRAAAPLAASRRRIRNALAVSVLDADAGSGASHSAPPRRDPPRPGTPRHDLCPRAWAGCGTADAGPRKESGTQDEAGILTEGR